jgi:hypothetical protein
LKRICLFLLLLATLSFNQKALCATPDSLAIAPPPSVLLPIPNRLQDRDKPPQGWCAEASIQMGLLFFNKMVSQKEINTSGKPKHPDLNSNDINNALKYLNVNFTEWNADNHLLPQFMTWIQSNIAKGYPVICGVKINPTRHPEWPLDHFVLAVGYNESGLFINTNHDVGQVLITYEQLASESNRYSFQNSYHRFFGRALTGLMQ